MNDKELIEQLREENSYLKKILERNNIPFSPYKKIQNLLLNKDKKIELFLSYFKGRDDIFAYQYVSKEGRKGCAPICSNKENNKFCKYSLNYKCRECPYKKYRGINKDDILMHLKGDAIYGFYPLLNGDYCNLLAFDFDDTDFINSAKYFRNTCRKFGIDCLVEISQSGNGTHVWIFFETPVKALKARKLGKILLLDAMNETKGIDFDSFDRMFPSQDFLPNSGYGNLIIYPLQGSKAKTGCTLFVDDNFVPYPIKSQMDILSSTIKIKEETIDRILFEHKDVLQKGEINNGGSIKETKNDFAGKVEIEIEKEIKIDKSCLNHKSVKALKRIGSIPNPKFYELQSIRKSTFKVPQILGLFKEDDDNLYLPRGCFSDVESLLKSIEKDYSIIDKRQKGKRIDIEFNGNLKKEQIEGLNELLKFKNGLFVAPTAFGKTVTAINLISVIKRNTLIIVPTLSLLNQWKQKLNQFLNISYSFDKNNKFGVFYGAKKKLNSKIDIASIDSLNTDSGKSILSNYGLVIVDEVHHVGALTYENIIRNISSEYLYGFTATPKRSDKYEKIIFKLFGDIRYQSKNNCSELSKILNPVFSQMNFTKEELTLPYSSLIDILFNNENRNNLIVDNIKEQLKKSKNILVLTDRIEHIDILKNKIKLNNVFVVNGMQSKKENEDILKDIENQPNGFVILSTGKYIGEGFDLKRLNCLFLVAPFKWSGTLEQYVGRLHRIDEDKHEVNVIDIVDYKIPMFEIMYHKRLSGYRKLGYAINGESSIFEKTIYSKKDYFDAIRTDIQCSKKQISYIICDYDETVLSTLLELGNNNYLYVKSDFSFEHRNIKKVSTTNYKFNAIIIDHQIVWYGGLNPFSSKNSNKLIMRVDDKNTALSIEQELK